MKYEMIFGDYKFANRTCEIAMQSDHGEVIEMTLTVPVVVPEGWRMIAMRRIIKEPKRWTWEDKKAGRLPEIGCRVDFCHKLNTNWRTGEIKYIDNQVAVIKADDIDRPFVYEFDRVEFRPIETPAEKAQREENEWVNKALGETAVFAGVTQDEHDRLRIHLRHIYRAQLSGELAAPKGGE